MLRASDRPVSSAVAEQFLLILGLSFNDTEIDDSESSLIDSSC